MYGIRLLALLLGFLVAFQPIALAQSMQTKAPPPAPGTASSATVSPEMAEVSGPVGDKWALVIGISKFADPSLNLKYAAKDARDFYDFLVQEANFAPDHVQLLLNEDATRETILDMFGDKWLPHAALPGDLVVIYISTHGSPGSVDVANANYLLAHNTDKERLFSTGVSLQELVRLVKDRIHCKRVVTILDTCYSGAAASSDSKDVVRRANVNVEEIAQGTGQVVICSSEPAQVSWESKSYPNGVFTRRLIEALKFKGINTPLDEACAFVKDRVQEEVVQDRGVLQTPVYKSKLEGGKIYLSALPTKPHKAPYMPPLHTAPAVATAVDLTPPSAGQPTNSLPPPDLSKWATTPTTNNTQQLARAYPPPERTVPPPLSWESWVTRMQVARKMIKNDQDQEGNQMMTLASADRGNMGENDPRVALQIAKNNAPKDNSPEASNTILKTHMDKGRQAYEKEAYSEAEAAFKGALKECSTKSNDIQEFGSTVLDALGVSLLYQTKYNEAKDCLSRAVAMDQSNSQTKPEVAALHLEHYAAILYAFGEFAEAEKAGKLALTIWEQQLGLNHPKVAGALNLLGLIAYEQKKYPEAELLIRRAQTIDEEAPWFKLPDVGQAYFELALLDQEQGRYKDAELLLKKAIVAREKQFGLSDIRLAPILTVGAINGLSQKKPMVVETTSRRAFAIAQKRLPADHPYIRYTAAKLADSYKLPPRPIKLVQLQKQFPDLETNRQEQSQRLFYFQKLSLSLPVKFTDSWNVHLTEKWGDLYGRATWDPAKKHFTLSWDNGEIATLKVVRYEKGLPVLSYSDTIGEHYGSMTVKEMKNNQAQGTTSMFGVWVNGTWESAW